MEAHANDLRAEVEDEGLVEAVKRDFRKADLDAATMGLLEYAQKLTRAPASMVEADIESLRDLGWSDRAIHDAAQVCAYFNYINRIADGLGVDPEPE